MGTILITGRNGFIGQALVPLLKEKNTVVSLIRQKKNHIDYTGEVLIISDIRDVNLEEIRKNKITLILHLAAQIRGRSLTMEENNMKSFETILYIAKILNVSLVYLSSVNAVYQESLGSYAKSKKKCEDSLLKETTIPFLIIRVPLVTAGNAPNLKTLKNFYERFSFLPLFGKQEGKIQPVHISSLVDSMLKIIDRGQFSREIINIVGQEKFTYRQILEQLIDGHRRNRFLVFPYFGTLRLTQFFERIGLPLSISSEEIRSINMDKIVDSRRNEQVIFMNNDLKTLFE